MSSELIFITGASGFLGSHVVLQLLEGGYRVRAAARGAKVEHLKASYASYGDRFEAVKITDIVREQFPDALAGVNAVMHLASPLPGDIEPAEQIKIAIEGTLNVIVQAEKAGVRRVVVTSSIVSVMNPDEKYTDKDWNPVTREIALTSGSKLASYAASKKLAELALWEWAEKHPHVEVTTLNPTFFYGPFTPHLSIPVGDLTAISTDAIVYNLLFTDGAFPITTRYVDVRDVARAHVRALSSPPTAEVGRKRIIFSSPTGLPFERTLALIREKRPRLAGRLIKAVPEVFPSDVVPLDFERVEKVLGLKKEDFHTTEQTILDTVDALIEVEENWKKTGYTVQTPPPYAA